MLIWEGRTVSLRDQNVVVIEKLGRSGNVIVERVKQPYKRELVHKSQLMRRIHGRGERKWQLV